MLQEERCIEYQSEMRMSCGSGLLRHGLNFSTAWCTDQCWKRQEACTNAEGGHSEQLQWQCLPDIPVSTHHNRFFSQPSMTTHNWLSSESPTFEGMQQTFSQMKKFCNSVVTFQVGWASGLQLVFFWDNINNQKCVWIGLILLKMTFWGFAR